jgi:hypothetical protein
VTEYFPVALAKIIITLNNNSYFNQPKLIDSLSILQTTFMKHTLLAITGFIVLGLATTIGCKKTTNNTATAVSTTTINQLFDQLKYTPQEILVWAGRDTIVWGADTTMLHFYTNSFKDANNNVISGQQIYVHLTEMYKGGDMIANRTSTIAGDTLLQSAGEVNIFFSTLTGETVYTNGYGIGFHQSSASTQPMQLYYGNNNNADSVVYWTQGNISSPGANAAGTTSKDYQYDSSHHIFVFLFDTCINTSFVNADYFYRNGLDTSGSTNIRLTTNDISFNDSNTSCYLYFPSISCIIPMISYSAGYIFQPFDNIDGLPLGLSYKCIVVSVKNGTCYSYTTSGTITAGLNIQATMTPSTVSAVQTMLHGL